ncbi:MAG: type I-G CRISPR-associated protein Csb2, partial [Planctomycetaceae bacterium]
LMGQQLKPKRGDEFGESGPPTMIRVHRDNIARRFTEPANAWASVTPVILPGHNDRNPGKTRRLIEKALAQSGVGQPCEFEWSPFSHFRKSFSAHKDDKDKRIGYIRPDHLPTQTAVHLTLKLNDGTKMAGPVAIGAGRHCGLGIFAGAD